MENTDFVIEHIDEEVQVIADQPSVVTNYPANTDFFIENIDSNVISIAHSLNIEASEVNFRPANTDFFIENIDKNVIAIAESMNLSPSEVDFRPANTDFFVENIDKNLIKIAESLSLTPYEVTIRPANTDMFIENIDKNVTLIKGSTNVVTVSGEYININLPDGGKVQSAQLNGNATQTTYSGKNKIDGANPTDANFATASLSNNVITVSSTATDTLPYARWVIDNLSANDVVRYSGVIMDSNGQIVLQYDNNGTWVTISGSSRQYSDGTTAATYAWTNTLNTTKVRFLLYANKTIPTGNSSSRYKNTILTVNNSDLSYEPFVGGIPAPNPSYPQPISTVTGENVVKVVGKNLLAPFDWTRLSAGITFTASNGGITISGTATSNAFMCGNAEMVNNFPHAILPAGTYTLSAKDGMAGAQFRIVDVSSYTVLAYCEAQSTTFTLTEQHEVSINARVSSGTVIATPVTIYPQLELGSQASDYQPYQGQEFPIDLGSIELAKIPGSDYKDKILYDKTIGKWRIEKQVGKVVFDGTEAWAYYSSYGGFRYKNDGFNVSSNNPSEDLICSHFTVATVRGASPTAPVIKSYTLNTDSTYIFLCDGTSDVTAFKTWLASNPTTVYYALATPTTTEITDQTLIDQLEALASATLGYGVNNIWIEIATGNAMPTLELVIEKY